MEIDEIANVVSLIAGLMTIFGIGGLFSWSLVRKSNESLPDATISIFAMSLKLGICILLLWIFALPAHFLHIFVVLTLGKGRMGGADFYWGGEDWYAYIASYLIGFLVWIPTYLILCACTFSWSFTPVKIFVERLKGSPMPSRNIDV